MDMVFMIIYMTHIMILSYIPGDGDMDGLGDLGAAGMEVCGDGTILIDGHTGDGDQDGIMDVGDIMHGTTEGIPTEVVWEVSVTASTVDKESEPASLRMGVTQVCPEVRSEEEVRA